MLDDTIQLWAVINTSEMETAKEWLKAHIDLDQETQMYD
jgi:hypothetical protein